VSSVQETRWWPDFRWGKAFFGSPLNGQANLVSFPVDQADTFLTLVVLSLSAGLGLGWTTCSTPHYYYKADPADPLGNIINHVTWTSKYFQLTRKSRCWEWAGKMILKCPWWQFSLMLTGDRSSLGAVQSPDLRRWRKEMAMAMGDGWWNPP